MLLLLLRSNAVIVVPDLVIYEVFTCDLSGAFPAQIDGGFLSCAIDQPLSAQIESPNSTAEIGAAILVADIETAFEAA